MPSLKFTSWFVICHIHKAHCPDQYGVHPDGRSLSIKQYPAYITGQSAFYCHYRSGITSKRVLDHFPKDHGFELIICPKHISIININNKFTLKQDQLERAYEAMRQDSANELQLEMKRKALTRRPYAVANNINSLKRLCKESQDYYSRDVRDVAGDSNAGCQAEGNTSGPLETSNTRLRKASDPNNNHELGDEEVKIKTMKLKLSSPPFQDYQGFLNTAKNKRKPRKCKKARPDDDNSALQTKNALKQLFDGYKWCRKSLVQIQDTLNTTNVLIEELSGACVSSSTTTLDMLMKIRKSLQNPQLSMLPPDASVSGSTSDSRAKADE